MNTIEAGMVLRKVQAYRPSQIVDQLTVDAWQEAFDDLRLEDALLAVRNLGRDSADYLTPAQIRTEVKRIRKRRHEAHGEPVPPADLTPVQTIAWLRDVLRRIGDGETVEQGRGELRPMGEVRQLLDSKNLRKGAGS